MRRQTLLAAAVVGLAAFALYHATLLPGLDLGDTASFQATVGSPVITPRDGYPLYFSLGNIVLWMTRGQPAHALNLASAIEGATACAVLVLAGTTLSGSLAAAVGASLLFAASYTFWSQAIIGEVYALHMILVALTLWLVLRWAEQPTMRRLAVFLAVYALGFGNHLSMILLAPGFTLFLLLSAPDGWRSMFAPRVVGLAALCAVLGSLQYIWNLHALWVRPDPPDNMVVALQQFWFDVTKADWRETMVMNVPRVLLGDHARMYRFDLHQQFGWIGPVLAVAGLVHLARTNGRRAALVFSLYLVNVLFAFDYNVGDTHVFYLPSHLIIALLAGPGLVALFGPWRAWGDRATAPRAAGARRRPRSGVRPLHLAALGLVAYAGVRAWHDYPALDRSRDNRPTRVLADLTAGLDDRHAILLTDLDWQLENGLTYFAKQIRPDVATMRMADAVLYLPALVASNAAIDRDVLVTDGARRTLAAAYGPLLATTPDLRVAAPTLSAATAQFSTGARYVVCILKPTHDFALDWEELGRTLAALAGGRPIHVPDGDYVAVAGIVGDAPSLVLGSNAPFRRALSLAGVDVDIRMESWLAADTIRRMGFGHVIAGRHHALIVERGVSVVALDGAGSPLRTAYASSIFAPLPRYLIRR